MRTAPTMLPTFLGVIAAFLLGAALAFFWLTPMSIVVVHHIAAGMGIRINWQASDYYGLVVMMSLLTGLCFQFPLALDRKSTRLNSSHT